MYAVFRTKKFDKEFDKRLSREEQKEIENFEKKNLVNYLIYDDLKAVLMVGISDKKAQQETIDEIKSRLTEYYEVIKEAIRQHA